MIRASTRWLAAAACTLVVLWLWTWAAAQWQLEMPAFNQPMTLLRPIAPPLGLTTSTVKREPDASALLRSPAFYSDRRPHSFQPGAPADQPMQPAQFGYQLTTTVVGKKHIFAMLRLPGSNRSLIARLGEPFEGDPAWHATEINNASIRLTGNQGQEVRLALKPLTPTQPSLYTQPISMAASQPTTAAMNSQNAPLPPAASIQPAQGDAGLRARIDARRREAAASASAVGTQ